MPSTGIQGVRHPFVFAVLLAGLSVAIGSQQTQCQTGVHANADDQAVPQLKIESNLVLVRVVVRDAEGHPVHGLRKDDFKLFDRGKEQTISQFEDESQAGAPQNAATTQPPGQSPAPPTTAGPERFIAFYFDNFNSSDADLIQARDAADAYFAAGLNPKDRVAIFTPERVLSDFTSEPRQLREGLSHLRFSPRGVNRAHGCPEVSDYQAQELLNTNDLDSNAWRAVWAEARTCAVRSFASAQDPNDPRPDADSMRAIREVAQGILDQANDLARTNLEQFGQVVKFLARAPGQRTIILVSPGFLAGNEQLPLDRAIDRALRSQVVINSLNPRGLAVLMRESDASRGSALADPHASLARNAIARDREFVANDVLAEVAQGTGGQFFHDDNDLKAGFEALANHSADYVLAFSPPDMKLDGKFHELKVTLVEKRKGYTVQSRRGYFAVANEAGAAVEPAPANSQSHGQHGAIAAVQPEASNSAPTAEARQPKAPSSEENDQQRVQEALRSKVDSTGLPVGMEDSPSEGQGETRLLALTVHLDTKPLPLRKDAGHNLNTVTFAVAVFDEKDNVVQVKQRRAKVDLTDDQLPDFFNDGLEVNMIFELKPGNYRLRVAVVESQEHRLGSFSRAAQHPVIPVLQTELQRTGGITDNSQLKGQ